MLPHGLDAHCVARGVQDRELFPRFGGDLIGGRLCAPDRDAWFQSADHVHGDRSNPDIGRGFQICGWREVDLKVRREDSDDSRTKGLPLI